MPRQAPRSFEPRKSPVQARSTASVEAILKATIQVLLKRGKEDLTTTLVAARAGVSVGTLYQYFPNKSALLRAALQRHLAEIEAVIETVCRAEAGSTLQKMATALVAGFLEAKMKDARTSAALYAVSSDVDGARIVREMSARTNRAIAAMLASAKDPLTVDPQLVASMLQAAMAGVIRQVLESPSPESKLEKLRDELVVLVNSYVRACSNGSATKLKMG